MVRIFGINNIITINKLNTCHKLAHSSELFAIPFVAQPIITYFAANNPKKLAKKIAEEKIENKTNHPLNDRYKQNYKALKKAGLDDSEIKKHIDVDGYMDKKGKEFCESQGITSFKGREHTDGHLDIHDLSDTPSVSEIRDIDVSMPIELQEYMDTPMDHVQSGLISNIFDEFPDDFDVDEGLLSKLRGFIEHVEEWL